MKLFLTSAVCLTVLVQSSGALPNKWAQWGAPPAPKHDDYKEPKYPEVQEYKEPEYPEEPEYPAEPKYEPEPDAYKAPEPEYPAEPQYNSEPEYPAAASYNKDYCQTYYDTEYDEKCVHYHDKVCYTTNTEHCKDVERQTCQGIVTTDQVRQCVNVTELLCGLAETVQYEMVHTGYTVQKCQTVKERVCDTVYEPQTKTQDDYQCIKLPTYNCFHKEKTIYDKVCRHVTKYDCETYEADSYKKPSSGAGSYGSNQDQYGAGGDYNQPEYKYECKDKTEVNCYDTPRVVKYLVCTDGEEKVCEKFPEKVPSAVEKQNCHDEDKKVCEMEARKQPKQVKKYVYKKQCRKVPRQICSSADVKRLMPQCTPTSYKSCDYTPHDKCEKVAKKYCFKVPKKVKKTSCEKKAYSAAGDEYQQPTQY